MKRILVVLIFIVKSKIGLAQVFSTQGTDFWFYQVHGILYSKLLICSDYNTTLSISYYKSGQTFTIYKNVSSGVCDTIRINKIPNIGYSQSYDTVALYLKSTFPITTYLMAGLETPIGSQFTLFPTTNLLFSTLLSGYNYMAMCFPDDQEYYHAVTFFDNTLIKISPTANNFLGGPGNPYSELLPVASVWAEEDFDPISGSLMESQVTGGSKKPFNMFSGRWAIASLPISFLDQDPIISQQLPIDKWGMYYHAVPHQTRMGDNYRILAAYDSTEVIINYQDTIALNSQQWLDTLLSVSSTFVSNKPVNVTEMSRDAIADTVVNSNSFMYPLMNDSNLLTRARFATDWNANAYGIITTNYLNLVCKTANTSFVKLNGLTVSSSFIPYFNDSAWSYAQLTIPNGTHLLEADSGVIAYQYGYGPYRGHGNIIGGSKMFFLNTINDAAKKQETVSIYPNPAHDIVYLKWERRNIRSLIISNVLGIEIKRIPLDNYFFYSIGIDVHDLSKGIYFITIQFVDSQLTEKFIKK